MKLSTRILLAFALIILLTIIDSYTYYKLSLKVKRNSEFLNSSESIIRNSARIHKAIIEMQGAFRGYLLTDDPTFLENYVKGISLVPELLADQRKFIRNNEQQNSLLNSIEKLHLEWIRYANVLINAKKSVTLSEESQRNYQVLFDTRLKKQIGKRLNDQITILFGVFDRNEYRLRKIHSENLIASIRKTQTISVIFLAITIIVGIISTYYIVSVISKRIQTMVDLSERISNGEFTSVKDDKNDELSRLSGSLNIMSANLKKNIKELEKRNRELDKFSYVVSHDLKAPLRGIHNAVKWIEEDYGTALTPQLKHYLSIIPQRTQRMEALINGLLDYARLRKKSQPEKIDVFELVNEIVNTMVPRNINVEIGKLPFIYTERLKLEQVFTNLISNSVKYIQETQGEIAISCKENSSEYEFSVRDNGIGIDPEYHDKIFEIFQTLREKNEAESTGIGLAITRRIIDDQHGSIRINSSLGKGAEFIFTWPRTTV